MNESSIRMGQARMQAASRDVSGEYLNRGAERFYRIENFDRMPAFFMSIVSSSNHWMFISSLGGLTAGRQNADNALFPYYTEDRIHDGSGNTGARTIVRVARDDETFLWEPFSPCARGGRSLYAVTRNLYKNVPGNKLVFEEENHDLQLVFRYTWTFSDRFGFIKHSEIENRCGEAVAVDLLDGVENLLPRGITEAFQNAYSCLGDAYKQNELEESSGIATFAFSSLPGDNPEPSESLRATVCWSTAPVAATRLLSSLQLDAFARGAQLTGETRICGRRGAYFVHAALDLAAGEISDWLIVADLDYGLPEIAALKNVAADSPETRGDDLKRLVLADVETGTERLRAIVGRSDGLQTTGDELGCAHHFANVMFNVMRGGIFESAYAIPVADLKNHIRQFNRNTFARREDFLAQLGDTIDLALLLEKARSLEDPEFLRLVLEYLPLSFSRRHGDPSRPWNKFSINVKSRDGSSILDYQGNWRDIFQNWEALCLSFPAYVHSIIARFLNTSTADGYNPYRVTKRGYEWEAPDPDDPWAHFGYWGDHQLIYLLKFLELSRRYYPGSLEQSLNEALFVHAEVPYDIKPYSELLADPRQSIAYNRKREEAIQQRIDATGLDGKYMVDPAGETIRVNLGEKLLLPLLAKVGNFVPGAGFWMNTQRPEWNDANNALAGFGASMVTLYYARRYVTFLLDLLNTSQGSGIELGVEFGAWFRATATALDGHRGILTQNDISAEARRELLDDLGAAADTYRTGLYTEGLSGRRVELSTPDVVAFLELAQAFFDQTIRLNQRDDGLYHAYNVLVFESGRVRIERLQAMLEGQVAVLSSGSLVPKDVLRVLRALRGSEMYRADQHSYLLYPNRQLPGFLEKNIIPGALAGRSTLFERLIEDGNSDLVERDVHGELHFNGLFKNIRDVRAALERLADSGYRDVVDEEAELIPEIFEAVFNHSMFTGRSGTFYGYEGLGCIYWHMVSKLLLATQENVLAVGAGSEQLPELAAAYYDVREGIGFNKSPEVYGAFPTDPYSHTPGFAGAKQPGMTGQVKEEVITRLGELGLFVRAGQIEFSPILLRRLEFLDKPCTFEYLDVTGAKRVLHIESGQLAFTYCQVPILYRLGNASSVTLHLSDNSARTVEGLSLDASSSRDVFARTGVVSRIEVELEDSVPLPES